MVNSENKVPKIGALGIVGIFTCMFLFMMTILNAINVYYLQVDVALLNEEIAFMRVYGPCSHQSRQKRNTVGSTDDGVLVNSESYAEHKRFNISHQRYPDFKGLSVTSMPAQASFIGSYSSLNTDQEPTKKATVHVRKSRVMRLDGKPREYSPVRKSALKSGDSMYASSEYPESTDSVTREDNVHITTRRRTRQRMETLDERHPRTGRIKPLPTIHFSGDTSSYVFGTHENFNGNGHLRHPQRTFVDWKVNNWAEKTGMANHFSLEDGYVTIKESGIYFIYAQIYYLDEHDQNGYRVYKNGDTILQCTVYSNSNRRTAKGNTCYTAGAEYFGEGDKISLGDLSDGRYSLFEPGKSFFGIIKLGDIKVRL